MGFGHAIQQRIDQLREQGKNIPSIIIRVQKDAIAAAVERATKMTPPNDDSPLAGTGMQTGQAKAHWASDSVTVPEQSGNSFTVILANNVDYISYLNDGHRMDRHFVPGLMVNPYSGLLEKVPREMGGIMVGVKTKRVKGIYMADTAKTVYRGIVESELIREVREGLE